MTAKMHKDCQQLRDLIEISVYQLQGIASCGLITVNGENRMEGLVWLIQLWGKWQPIYTEIWGSWQVPSWT